MEKNIELLSRTSLLN